MSPQIGRLDSTLTIAVHGLVHASTVTVKASALDDRQTTWTAQARYRVPADGVVPLSEPPIAGSYRGADPMGLLLTMSPLAVHANTPLPSFIAPKGGCTVELTARVDGSTVATARAVRDIPLEYFAKAISVLRAQPDVDSHHVLVYGVSRGGELALLLGATYPSQIDGVIAGSPSSTVNGSYPAAHGSAWTLRGAPLTAGRAIPVERIRGPVLQACGEMDTVWPSCASLAAIRARLAAHHFRFPVTTLQFPDAGHFGGALTCCTSVVNDYGGTPGGNALAQLRGYGALLSFLAQQ